MSNRFFVSALVVISFLVAGCGGEGESSEPPLTTTTVAAAPTTTAIATTSSAPTATTSAPPATSIPGPVVASPFDTGWHSVAHYLADWSFTAESIVDAGGADLGPSMSVADVASGDGDDIGVFAEQVSDSTAFGGIVSVETGELLGSLALTDPDSGEFSEMVTVSWAAAFGVGALEDSAAAIGVDVLSTLAEGDGISGDYDARSWILQHVAGGEPGDGVFMLTIADPASNSADHSTISDPVLDWLISTS